MIRRTIRRFWFRYIGVLGFAAIVSLNGIELFLILSGDRSWVAGALGAMAIMLPLTAFGGYITYLRRSITAFRRMNVPTATFELAEDGFTMSSDAGSSHLAWKSIERIWQFPDAWLLFLGKNAFFTLPIAEVPHDAMQFIAERVRETGGNVV